MNNHLIAWLNHQFEIKEAVSLYEPMVRKMEEDLEYWERQTYWKIYDALDSEYRYQ